VFAKKLIVAHVKVLATAALLFLFLGFMDRIPDDPGVFRERGLSSARVFQAPVAPEQPSNIVAARLVVNGYAASSTILDCEISSANFLYCNGNALLSVAADSSPPLS
jgi:hypothetical protein